jgi:outer membrane protein OmpA-like peptidoglycan-associated protein
MVRISSTLVIALAVAFTWPSVSNGQTPDIPEDAPPPPKATPKAEAPRKRSSSASTVAVEETPAVEAVAPIKKDGEGEHASGRLAPSPSGETGLIRVHSADSVKLKLIRLSFSLDFFAVSSFFADSDSHSSIGGVLGISMTPINYLELWINTRQSASSNSRTTPQLLQAQGDLSLGAKGFYPANDMFTVGVDGQLTALTGVGKTSFDSVIFRFGAVATADLQKSQNLPIRAHANLGFILDGSNKLVSGPLSNAERFALGISDYNRVGLGLAGEVPLKYVTLFLEYSAEFPLGYLATPGIVIQSSALRPLQAMPPANNVAVCDPSSGNDAGCARPSYMSAVPQRLTPGVRVTAIPDLTLDAAVEIGLTPNNTVTGILPVPRYNVVLLASYPLDPFNENKGPPVAVPVLVPEVKEVSEKPQTGQVAGVIKSKTDGAEVSGAVVSFDRAPPVATSPNGMFKSHDIEPGPVTLSITKDGFEPTTASATIVAGEAAQIEVQMVPQVREGAIRGRIVDDKDKPLANVRVEISGPTTQTLSTGADGSYELKALAGKYVLTANLEGYLEKGRELDLKGGETMTAELLLRKRPKQPIVEVTKDQIVLKESVHFVTGEAHLAPDAASVLDSVVDALVKNKQIKRLRIEGHTDNVGTDQANQQLSKDRAEAVVQYLVQQGIDGSRLSSEGFGASRPIAPNLTRRGREQNRRVEFHIVGE